MGLWKGFCNLPGFICRVKANVDFGGNAAADVLGEKPADIVWTSDVRPCGRVSREDAKARKVGDRVPQLPKAFCGREGVLECSGLTELWMGRERVDGKIQSGVKPPQFKKPGSGISREDAKARRKGRRRFSVSSLAQVVQWPKAFCGREGVLECSGWTELGMGIERVEGENPKRCPATAVQEIRLRSEFLENDRRRVLA
jgi:hypothetical protein